MSEPKDQSIEDELDAALAALDSGPLPTSTLPEPQPSPERATPASCRPRRPRRRRPSRRHRPPEARRWTPWKKTAAPKPAPFASTVRTRCGSHRRRK